MPSINVNSDRYFCFYSNGSNSNESKLIFAKLKKIKNVFTKDTVKELEKTHTLFHCDYNSMDISSKLQTPYMNDGDNNTIKTEHKEVFKTKIDDFIKNNNLVDYTVSFISFDKFNLKMKVLLSTTSKCIKTGDVIFNNQKLHNILIKLKDKTITNKSLFINTLFTENECKYVYNFINFYYKYADISILYDYNTNTEGKTEEEQLEIETANKEKINGSNDKIVCQNIKKHFDIYMDKLKDDTLNKTFDITHPIDNEIPYRGLRKKMYVINPNNNYENIRTTSYRNRNDFVKYIDVSEGFTSLKTDYEFITESVHKNVDYIKKLFENNYNKINFISNYTKNLVNIDSTSIYNISINLKNIVKSYFVNNNILSKKHNNMLKIKVEYDLCYIQNSTNLIYIEKYNYYLNNEILNSLLDKNIYIYKEWFSYFFNIYFSFEYTRLTSSKFYTSSKDYNYNYTKPLTVINNTMLMNLVKKVSNKNINFSSFDNGDLFKNENIKKVLENFTIQPFDYQKQNVSWMKSIEENVISNNTNIPYICNPDYNIIKKVSDKANYCYIINNKFDKYRKIGKLYRHNKTFLKKYTSNIKMCGGILSDDVGLGKTLSCITHIITSLTSDILDEYKQQNPYNANNLIIVPNRLVAQWYTEIKNYLTSSLFKKVNVIKITTITDIKKKLYNKDYTTYSIYIISSNLINNNTYFNYLSSNCYDISSYLKKIKKLKSNDKKNHHKLIKSTTKKYEEFVKLESWE